MRKYPCGLKLEKHTSNPYAIVIPKQKIAFTVEVAFGALCSPPDSLSKALGWYPDSACQVYRTYQGSIWTPKSPLPLITGILDVSEDTTISELHLHTVRLYQDYAFFDFITRYPSIKYTVAPWEPVRTGTVTLTLEDQTTLLLSISERLDSFAQVISTPMKA